jgi:hypothetical protein
MSEEESPLLKDYTNKIDELITDMAGVCCEVIDFLAKRYGDAYKLNNLIAFTHVFTCITLLKYGVPLDRYIEGLKAMYDWLAGLRKLCL